jgi:peroxiredoxin/predicted 2-oxoglutarate/Fe(II)-dependent dioxygenase YbiX
MARRTFFIGDPVPDFICDSTSSPTYHFNTAAGRYVVITFFGSAATDKGALVINAISNELRKYFNDKKAAFFGVSIDSEDKAQSRGQQSMPGIRFFWDFDRKVSIGYGAIDPASEADGQLIYHPFTLVLDPFFRVIGNIPLADADKHNQILANLLANLPSVDHHAGVPIHAPVLVLPRVFDPQFCRELIKLYEQNGGGESGFMREKDGNTVGIMDHSFKRRKDFTFEDTPEHEELRTKLRSILGRRLTPEIYKSFQFNVTRIERYLVACYEGEVGGFFRAHRDNTTKGTAHRRFACTINLNADEYEGGDLRFPEFGTRNYRAPTGGAVVFSCSLLHEATPVTKGTRYAFLPFLYDDAAAKIRDENKKFITGQIIDKNKGDDEHITRDASPSEREGSSPP